MPKGKAQTPTPTIFYQFVGEEMNRRRRLLGMTQDEIAMQVGISRASLNNIEAGRQHTFLHVYVKIALALQIDLSALLPLTPMALKRWQR